MLTQKMEKTLNEQINAEMYSAYLYLSMSSYFESINLPGFANWMNVQFQEEWAHAMRIYNYVYERGGRVELLAIEKPKMEWKDTVDVFENTYEHEQHVTSLINNLYTIAIEEKDYATQSMLNWFIDEQVEEESTAISILDKLKMISGNNSALFMIDKEMSSRVFVDPNATAK